jgi:hypothetical protein
MFLATHCDDPPVFSSSMELLDRWSEALRQHFVITREVFPKSFSGLQVDYDLKARVFKLGNGHNVENLIDIWGLAESTLVRFPASPTNKHYEDERPNREALHHRVQKSCGQGI